MGSARRFEDLAVWQQALDLAALVDEWCATPRLNRQFALADQMRRAAISILSNIAEGFDRRAPRSFRYFLIVAKGSAAELRSQLYLAIRRGYIPTEQAEALQRRADDVGRMLGALIGYLDAVIRRSARHIRTDLKEPP